MPIRRPNRVLCLFGIKASPCLLASPSPTGPTGMIVHRRDPHRARIPRERSCDWSIANPIYDREHGDTGSSNARSRAPPLASPWYAGCRPLARNREPPAYDGHAPISRVALQQDWAYSITSSARASSIGGTVRPSALAVMRFTTRSNLVGCSTGISPGFVPRKILSANSAARRNILARFGP